MWFLLMTSKAPFDASKGAVVVISKTYTVFSQQLLDVIIFCLQQKQLNLVSATKLQQS